MSAEDGEPERRPDQLQELVRQRLAAKAEKDCTSSVYLKVIHVFRAPFLVSSAQTCFNLRISKALRSVLHVIIRYKSDSSDHAGAERTRRLADMANAEGPALGIVQGLHRGVMETQLPMPAQ